MINKDIERLAEPFRTKVKRFLNDEWIKMLWVIVTEARRSNERQKELYESWRTKPWPILTWTLQSLHINWLAIDIACNNTKLGLYPTDMNWWDNVYDIADMYWITSLYRLSKVDKPHLQDNPYHKPTDLYINQTLMQEITPKIREALINLNGTYWNITTNADLKRLLEQVNAILRTEK